MRDAQHNLLTDPLISVTLGGRDPARLSLPELLARLARDEPLELTALQPHQFHAWHAFTVQLAALATHHADTPVTAMTDPARWAVVLRDLTGGRDEPWCLIVSDLKQPAFMQPPVPEGSLDRWNHENVTVTPDEIDVLETAKNHDVKMQRVASPTPEYWLFAIVTLQTMQGFSGRDNYGIARMNGGVSNRPAFATAHDLALPTRFVRDVELLREARSTLIENYAYEPESGLTLLWLEPWDGTGQISLSELDPFFIEICRRMRLFIERGQLVARWTTTKAARIAAKEQKGNLGDPWVPVRRENSAALTARDLNYARLQEVIFGPDYQHSAASAPRPSDGDTPLLICQLLARDQGKTEGYHERIIPLPLKARAWLATQDGRRRLSELSHSRIKAVKEVVTNVVHPSLSALIQTEIPKKKSSKQKGKHPWAIPFINWFDREVDRIYFSELFDSFELSDEAARIQWLSRLLGLARSVLDNAERSAPVSAARLFRARAAAEYVFRLNKNQLRANAGEFIEKEVSIADETILS